MYKKTVRLFVVLMIIYLYPYVVCAQSLFQGIVLDESTGNPLSGALIISDRDTTVSDSGGIFSVFIDSSSIHLTISYLGYKPLEKQLQFTGKQYSLYLKPSTLALNEVVVSSGGENIKGRNAPNSIALITKDMIRRDAPFSITPSINRVPGVFMQSGTYTTNRVTIRGIGTRSLYGTNKIKAYFDQIPLTDGSGNSSIEDIDQSLIDRIEITKGPNSSQFGAGLAGLVRMYSYQPVSNQTSLESSLDLGSYNTIRWASRFSHQQDNKSLNLTYSLTESDGFRENNEYKRSQVGLNSRILLNKKSQIDLLGVFTKLKGYIPSSISEEDYLTTPEKAAFTWNQAEGYEQYDKGLFGMSYKSELANQWRMASSVFFNYRDAYEPRPFNILDENTQSMGTRNVVNFVTDGFELSGGFELFADRYQWKTFENLYDDTSNGSVQGEMLSNNKENRYYYNFFIETHLSVTDKFRVTGGLNLNYTHYRLDDNFPDDADQSGSYDFDPILSPRLSLLYRTTDWLSIFINASHGFSPPGLDETLYPDGTINSSIRPETGWNFEVGGKGHFGHFNYDAVLYYMDIRDLLVSRRINEDQYIGVNAGKNRHIGLDLLANYYFEFTAGTLNLFNSLSWMDFTFSEFTDLGNDYAGNYLPGTPRLIVSPGLEYFADHFYGNVTGKYVGELPINDANDVYADPYFIMRGKVGYKTKLNRFELDVHVGIENITDTKYASMLLINATAFGNNSPRYYYPGMPRNYFGGASIKYLFRD